MMMRRPSRLFLWLALTVALGIVADLVWSRTNDPSLVERVLWGVLVLGIVFSERARLWLVELMARDQMHGTEFSPGDSWVGRALQAWLFPFALALIAEPLAHAYSARYPAVVALTVMFAATLAWSVVVLEPRTRSAHVRVGHLTNVWWQLALRRPTAVVLAGFLGGAFVVAVSFYANSAIRGLPWAQSNWAPVVVASFLGGLLAITRWEAVTSSKAFHGATPSGAPNSTRAEL